MTAGTPSLYPVHVEAALDDQLSRWRWLVKWFLAIPHYFVLAFLWIAFVVLSVVAFFAILFTGRYPRSIFDFNVGVLRWTWRVGYYAFDVMATDKYPPFTLAEVPEYPAHLDVEYPQHLSRGLVLVKWWLLAVPHYVVVGLFAGAGWWAWQHYDTGPGLIGLLAFIAVVILLFTGQYPRQLFDFLIGLNRWCLRVAAYASLMTDKYPPFRLDMGAHEPAGTLLVERPAGAGVDLSKPPTRPDTRRRYGWTGGRITAVVFGALLALVSLGGFAGGGVALWLDHHRDGGYVTSSTESRHSDGYAITSDRIELGSTPFDWQWGQDLLGKVRIRATSQTAVPIFVGIAPTDAVNRYLTGVPHTVLRDFTNDRASIVGGSAVPAAPTATSIWVTSAQGTGQQTLTWSPRGGDWTIVVMNADGQPSVSVTGDIGATLPSMAWIAAGLFIFGGFVLIGALLLLIIPIRRAGVPAPSGATA